MTTLYSLTIYADLALLAIVIAIFVFASSILGGASRISAEERENYLTRRKERIEKAKNEFLSEQIKGLDNEQFLTELKAKIIELDMDLKNIDRLISEARKKAKALTVRNIVAIPSIFLLISIISSGIAIVTSGILPIIIWALSLVLIAISLYLVFKNLIIIESFSSIMDLSTVIKQVFEPRNMKLEPIADAGKEIQQEVMAVLRTLPPRDSRIIEMYFGIGFNRMSPKEIAMEFGISQQTLRRVVAVSIRKCRHPSRSRRLRDYFDSIPVTGEKSGEQLFIESIFGGIDR